MGTIQGNGGRNEAILAAATELFGLYGVKAVTTQRIARRVGISQPSI